MLYQKIQAPYVRHTQGPDRNKLDMGNWARPEFELLKDLPWEWTEKVNGTNVRVIWDGHKVRFGGRTDDAQMPVKLLDRLREMFPEELMEQQFDENPAILYGEGYGAGINNGGDYGDSPDFALFDVVVRDKENSRDWWLLRDNVFAVAVGLGVGVVPLVMRGSIPQAIEWVSRGLTSDWGSFEAEGLVGRAPLGLCHRGGERLMVKVKTKDFRA